MKIYKITNLLNSKVYVGQTHGTPQVRFMQHCTPKSGRYSALTRAILKYGKENFRVDELQVCASQEELNKAEKEWIVRLGALGPQGYNLKEGGSNGRLTEEIKRKIGLRATGKKRADGGPMLGKRHTPEACAKISMAGMGKKYALGTVHTPEFKEACRIRTRERNKKEVIDLRSGVVFGSAKEAAESAHIKYTTLVGRLNGSNPTPTHFAYVNGGSK